MCPSLTPRCEYTLAEADICKRQLWVSVKNDVNLFSLSKTEMGQVLVDLRSLDITRAVTEWSVILFTLYLITALLYVTSFGEVN